MKGKRKERQRIGCRIKDGKKTGCRRKQRLKIQRGQDGIMKGRNIPKSTFRLSSFHLQFCDPRKHFRIVPVPSQLSTTPYTIGQLN